MENSSEKDTLPNLQTVLDAINGLRLEINEHFDKVEARLTNVEARITNVEARITNVEARITNIETDVNQVKEMQFVFENEFDRLIALSHKSLELSHENRADVRIMRKEISAWSRDVQALERRVA